MFEIFRAGKRTDNNGVAHNIPRKRPGQMCGRRPYKQYSQTAQARQAVF